MQYYTATDRDKLWTWLEQYINAAFPKEDGKYKATCWVQEDGIRETTDGRFAAPRIPDRLIVHWKVTEQEITAALTALTKIGGTIDELTQDDFPQPETPIEGA